VTEEERDRQFKLVAGFMHDGREMAKESGISECTYCQTTAMLCLLEMVQNEHDRCILKFLAEFFTRFMNQVDLERDRE